MKLVIKNEKKNIQISSRYFKSYNDHSWRVFDDAQG